MNKISLLVAVFVAGSWSLGLAQDASPAAGGAHRKCAG
jgi:hypothetical protein